MGSGGTHSGSVVAPRERIVARAGERAIALDGISGIVPATFSVPSVDRSVGYLFSPVSSVETARGCSQPRVILTCQILPDRGRYLEALEVNQGRNLTAVRQVGMRWSGAGRGPATQGCSKTSVYRRV